MHFRRLLSVLAVAAACFSVGYFVGPRDAALPPPAGEGVASPEPSSAAAMAAPATVVSALPGGAPPPRPVLSPVPAVPEQTDVADTPVSVPAGDLDDLDRLLELDSLDDADTTETIYVTLPPGVVPPPPPTPEEIGTPPRRGPFSATALAELSAALDKTFDAPAFDNALWGAVVRSMETGEDLYRRNDGKGFLPASNLKIFTCAAALAKLGPDFRYETKLYSTDADLTDGVVNGDLYVVGSGDPTFAARFRAGNSFQVFSDWAKALKEKGITRIEGDVIVDDSIFDDEAVPEGWGREYQNEPYSAEVAGVALNDNCVSLRVTPGAAAGDPVQVRVLPAEGYVEPVVKATTAAAGRGAASITFARQTDSNVIEVTGSLSAGSRAVEQATTIHNPTGYFAFHLRRVVEKSGIAVTGKPFDADDLPKARRRREGLTPLAEAQSPPLWLLVKATQKQSQNLYADHLLKTLGARKGGGGSFAAGARVVRDFLQANGVDASGFVMEDGSGLSRLNLVEPRQALGLLEAMRKQPCFPYFYDSLPSAGRDGGGIGRVSTGATSGRLHAKTGYIRRVWAVSGYIRDGDCETLGFSMLLNNHTASSDAAAAAQSRACDLLARFQGRRPAAAEETASADDATAPADSPGSDTSAAGAPKHLGTQSAKKPVTSAAARRKPATSR